MTNAATIRAAREAAGLSAREAAALVGVTTLTWQRWEGQSSRATEIPYAHWTLFILLVGSHPEFLLTPRKTC
jgi:DNA-binding transcriptional regulator YiaG